MKYALRLYAFEIEIRSNARRGEQKSKICTALSLS